METKIEHTVKLLKDFENLNKKIYILNNIKNKEKLNNYNNLVNLNFLEKNLNKDYSIFSITDIGLDIINIWSNKNNIISNIHLHFNKKFRKFA